MDKQVQGALPDIAMDLGTTSRAGGRTGRGILLQEPSVVAVDRRTGAVLQVGEAARQMLGRTPGDLLAVRPLRRASSPTAPSPRPWSEPFHKAAPGRLLKPRLLVCVPPGISEVAERAVVEAGLQASPAGLPDGGASGRRPWGRGGHHPARGPHGGGHPGRD